MDGWRVDLGRMCKSMGRGKSKNIMCNPDKIGQPNPRGSTQNEALWAICMSSNAFSACLLYIHSSTSYVCKLRWMIWCVSGNLLTVVALLRCPKLRSHATTLFVISLAISDLLFAAVNLPLTASRYVQEEWVLGATVCRWVRQFSPFFFPDPRQVYVLSSVVERHISISHLVNKFEKCACWTLRGDFLGFGGWWSICIGEPRHPILKE